MTNEHKPDGEIGSPRTRRWVGTIVAVIILVLAALAAYVVFSALADTPSTGGPPKHSHSAPY